MHIVILKGEDNSERALQRLQLNPLHAGLGEIGVRSTMVVLDGTRRDIAPPTHVVFNYRDKNAFLASVEAKKSFGCKLICFTSDIYDLSYFMSLAEQVDLFLAPTPLHRDIVQSAIARPVVHIPEAVDPIALPGSGPEQKVDAGGPVLWFGFPESFEISTRYLLPQAFALSGFDRQRFAIMTAAGATLMNGIAHVPFRSGDFYRLSAAYSHSLLSHFCYDQKLNTFIKSPNKLITSIVRGLVPLASATPSYSAIASQYGLQGLTFRGPAELAALLRNVDYPRDVERYGLRDVRADLLKTLSPAAIARHVLNVL